MTPIVVRDNSSDDVVTRVQAIMDRMNNIEIENKNNKYLHVMSVLFTFVVNVACIIFTFLK